MVTSAAAVAVRDLEAVCIVADAAVDSIEMLAVHYKADAVAAFDALVKSAVDIVH